MIDAERRALSALRFDLAPTPDDVWRPSPFNVADLHRDVVESVFEGVGQAKTSDEASPIGVVIQGSPGSGKTHLLGLVRARTQNDGGYFFLISLLSGKTFWESTALCIVDGLLRETIGWSSQLKAFLRKLTATLGVPTALRDAIAGDAPLTPADLDAFIAALRAHNRAVGQECQDTARALVLHGSAAMATQDLGYAYLNSIELVDFPDRADWGLSLSTRSPQLIVRDISRLLALTGSATVIAIDQIDTLFAQSAGSAINSGGALDDAAANLLGQVADGLMTLREVTRRALVVVACIPDTWAIIRRDSAAPVPDRFREAPFLGRVSNAKIGKAIVRKRIEARYAESGFRPPYPTWPIKELAFADADHFTPRALLKRVERHAAACVHVDAVTELEHLEDDSPGGDDPQWTEEGLPPSADELSELDDRFAELVKAAHIDDALTHTSEDRRMPVLLAAGLRALIEEQGDHGYKQDPLPSARPALHARLRQTLDEGLDDERHWAFRAIASNHPAAVISRIQAATTMAGLDPSVPKRKLFLLRNEEWPTGPKSVATLTAFHNAGGATIRVSTQDLAVFEALRILQTEQHEHLAGWLVIRMPASNTRLFQAVLGPGSAGVVAGNGIGPYWPASLMDVDDPEEPGPGRSARIAAPPTEPAAPSAIRLGVNLETGDAFDVELEALRKHMVIFAGSGSGKTVLIRRVVEECAIKGVSSIVLDPNNDLARFGDAWPQAPAGWGPGDEALAADFHEHTDVMVWTPRIDAGRPLTFQPLPDFAAVRNDPDEFRAAVDVAVAALAPRARVDGTTAKAQQGQAILRDALRYYARNNAWGGLRAFVGILAALPDGVSQLGKAERIATEMADTLTAAMVNDPLFGGEGTPVNPGVLLTPPPGKRARISVISFVGLHSDEQRQGFVNQLQMALFAWIKRNPAGERPLGGLFVMDEAQTLAPSSGTTACTASTLALVSQARKYGLGLMFATQAPRGLHNQIPGNAATQFFGLLNSPTQIATAREMAQAKGGTIPEIGLLTAGNFYAASEGLSFQKVRTPLSLSYHPKAPLTPEEVVARAAARVD